MHPWLWTYFQTYFRLRAHFRRWKKNRRRRAFRVFRQQEINMPRDACISSGRPHPKYRQFNLLITSCGALFLAVSCGFCVPTNHRAGIRLISEAVYRTIFTEFYSMNGLGESLCYSHCHSALSRWFLELSIRHCLYEKLEKQNGCVPTLSPLSTTGVSASSLNGPLLGQ